MQLRDSFVEVDPNTTAKNEIHNMMTTDGTKAITCDLWSLLE